MLLIAGAVWLVLGRTDTPADEPDLAENPVPSQITPTCGPVTAVDRTGRPLEVETLGLVRVVHEAACHHDYETLADLMDHPFGTRTADEAIAELRANDGASLTILTQTLEAAAIAGQGGLIYCHPHGAIAIFARGTSEHQWKFTDFSLTADSPAASTCFESGVR
ncbi:hypothetical protein AB0M80_15535 [Amycolatopsis sp. NPDC051045]|uniref:hypothetical protein n=1 Tax=Amycolatopsis sp. NPDC051045 TaxID=3156922 RepID=UPI00343200BF